MKVQEVLKSAIDAMENSKYYLDPDFIISHKLIDVAIIQCKSALSDIEKCEPVAEVLHERNRLGYAVVEVIGKLDEINENTQEIELDDVTQIAIPIELWNELQDALEEMPERADLYTSPQPIEKCEPVAEIIGASNDGSIHTLDWDYEDIKKLPIGTKLYPSPIRKESTDWQYFDEAYKKATESSEPDDWMNAALMAQQVRRKQLNAEKG